MNLFWLLFVDGGRPIVRLGAPPEPECVPGWYVYARVYVCVRACVRTPHAQRFDAKHIRFDIYRLQYGLIDVLCCVVPFCVQIYSV